MAQSTAARAVGIGGALVLLVVLAAAIVVSGDDDVDARTDGVVIECPADAVYGETITCAVTGAPADATIVWGDGAVTPASTIRRAVQTVGAAVPVEVVADGSTLAGTSVAIAPDLAVECEPTVPELQPVYELAAAVGDVREVWDYVYEDGDGNRVAPGDPDHPTDPGLTDTHAPIVIDRVERTGTCHTISAALDDLDGDVWWEIDGEWFDTITIRFRDPLIHMKGRWAGVQPGTATVFVEINDQQVSERVGVYSSGCT